MSVKITQINENQYGGTSMKRATQAFYPECADKQEHSGAKGKNCMKCAIIVVLCTALAGVSRGTPVVVSPGNMGVWSFGTADNNGNPPGNPGDVAQMVNGPATPPLGTGSAELATAPNHGDEAAFISTSAYDGIALSNLTSLSYSAYVTANNGSQFPYIQLSVASTGSGPADDILFFEPPYQTPSSGNPSLPNQGNTALSTWQLWNAQEGGWWSDDGNAGLNPGTGVGSLATYLASYPNATIEENPFAGGGISLTVGYASSGDTFTGYVDNVTIGTVSGTTTFDFEAVPEPSTMLLAVLGLTGMLIAFRRRKA
jgi:hypothetical protein